MDVAELVELLEMAPADGADGEDVFVGASPDRGRVYGGQFLAQALLAASYTVEPGRLPHSLHASFVRAGDSDEPIRYTVQRMRDGRNFSHRAVVAHQGPKEVFRQIQSFQVPTAGLTYDAGIDVRPGTDPSTFMGYRDWVAALSDRADHPWFTEDVPLDIRFENPPPTDPPQSVTETLRIWTRIDGAVASDDPVLHTALVAYLSDKSISDVCMYPHARSWTDEGSDVVSLDHAMWFHEPVRADQWLLLTHETPATRGGRGLARGDLATLDGRLVGAVAQEALLLTPD